MKEKKLKPWYNLLSPWFKGDYPPYYDVSKLPGTKILMDNYERIREEVLKHYVERPEDFTTNFVPYDYEKSGWQTVNLYTYFLRTTKNCKKFPVVHEVVSQIPMLCGCQIGVLKPQTMVTPHTGDTSIHIRSHMGVVIPGQLPELGIQVNREVRCWKEGEVLAICPAKRHYVWNYTDHFRIILAVDTFRPEFWNRRWLIAGRVLAGQMQRKMAANHAFLKKIPDPIVMALLYLNGLVFSLALILQRKLNFPIEKLRYFFDKR